MVVAIKYEHLVSKRQNVTTGVTICENLFLPLGLFTKSKNFNTKRGHCRRSSSSYFLCLETYTVSLPLSRSPSISVNSPLRKTVCCRNFLIYSKSLRISRTALHPLSGTNYKSLKPTQLTSCLHRIHSIHLKQVRLRKLQG